MSRLRPVPDRAGARARHALQLRALRHRAAADPRRSAEPSPGAHLRRPGAVRRAVARHADEGLDRRHRARDHAGIGADRAGQSRPVAACAGGRLHHGDRAAHQVRRHGLCPGRPQDALAAAQPARRIPGGAPHGHLGHARGAAARRVRGLHQARRPGHHRARPRRLCAGPAHRRHRVGRSRVRSPCRVGGDRTARPDARAAARSGAARLPARRRRLRALRPGLRAGRGRRQVPALRLCRARAQARQHRAHLGLRDRRRHPLHPGQRLSGAHRDPARRRRSPAPSWAASRSCWPRKCIRWRCWCSSPASWCRCSS